MTRAPAAAVKNIRTAAETRNSIAAKPGLVLCRLRLSYLQHIIIVKDVKRLLIEEYKPEISNLRQKLDEMRGSL